ncbi:MAG TPA: hypothetical protein DEQ47_17385 [Solibacterales bacterium]|nr:hypothetical protein [Bryobacterales bacterium]
MKQLLFLIALAALPAGAQVKITPDAGRVAIRIDGKPFADFFLAPGGNKPYVYPLRTPAGVVVTRHFPMESFPGETHDHPHHRGMFFAHGDVNGVNFWATEPSAKSPHAGRMIFRKLLEAKGGPKSGTIKAIFDGLDPQGKAMMTETRTLTFFAGDPRIVDFEVRIEALRPLKFGDTKEGTFGIRLATPLSEDKSGKMVNAEGAETEKNVWGKRSDWVDYSGLVNGKTVGVIIMDHPSNPRHPTYWHARGYGLFAANPFGVRDFTEDKTRDGSMTIDAGQSATFRYRVVIHDGALDHARIAELYRQYGQ